MRCKIVDIHDEDAWNDRNKPTLIGKEGEFETRRVKEDGWRSGTIWFDTEIPLFNRGADEPDLATMCFFFKVKVEEVHEES